jgi:hypothetical protein
MITLLVVEGLLGVFSACVGYFIVIPALSYELSVYPGVVMGLAYIGVVLG